MKEIAKTKKLLSLYLKGGMRLVAEYLSDSDLEFKEETWVFKAKKLLDSKCLKSLEQEIILILYKNDLNGRETEKPGEDS
jgi:hypothetical protein